MRTAIAILAVLAALFIGVRVAQKQSDPAAEIARMEIPTAVYDWKEVDRRELALGSTLLPEVGGVFLSGPGKYAIAVKAPRPVAVAVIPRTVAEKAVQEHQLRAEEYDCSEVDVTSAEFTCELPAGEHALAVVTRPTLTEQGKAVAGLAGGFSAAAGTAVNAATTTNSAKIVIERWECITNCPPKH